MHSPYTMYSIILFFICPVCPLPTLTYSKQEWHDMSLTLEIFMHCNQLLPNLYV